MTHLSIVYATDEVVFENLIENIGEDTYSAPDLDIIEYYREYQINLFSTNPEELSKLPGISLMAAQSIIDLVKNNPNIKNHTIANICELSPESEILLDVCTVINTKVNSSQKYGFISRTRYRHRFEDVKGIAESNYLGSKEDLYNRLIAYYSDFEFGLITNKHSGEINYSEFSSGYFKYDNKNSKLIVGDFYSDYGMGSLLWRQFAMQKGSEVISPVLNLGSGIAPYRSTLDFAHFRGLAAQTSLDLDKSNKIRISGFYSNRSKSATLDTSSSIVSSIYQSSYYRTENEISKKNILNEEAISANIELNTSFGLVAGLTSLRLNYDHRIESSSSSAFNGLDGELFSAYTMYNIGRNLLGIETALDANSNKLLRSGYIYSNKNIEFALSARYIDAEFRSPYGYSFGEFSYPSNEQGVYTSVLLKPNNKISLALFGDVYSSIARTFTMPAKNRGMDLFAELKYKPEQKSYFLFRLRRDNKRQLLTNNMEQRLLGEGVKYSARFEYNSELDKTIFLRLRCEISDYKDELKIGNGSGLMSFVDFKWNPLNNLKIGMRYTIFSTENFNSAIYQYEYTMPGTMRSTALYGKGSRVIITGEYRPVDFVRIYANYFVSTKNNVNIIGIGNEQTPDNDDSRAILQLEFFIK